MILEIGVHPASRKHADRILRTGGIDRRIFESRPHRFEEEAVLRIHDSGILRAEAKKLSIEGRQIVNRTMNRDERWVGAKLVGNASVAELGLRVGAERLTAIPEERPVIRDARRAGEASSQANNRYFRADFVIHAESIRGNDQQGWGEGPTRRGDIAGTTNAIC